MHKKFNSNNNTNPQTEMKRKRNLIGETRLFSVKRHAIATILPSQQIIVKLGLSVL